MLANLAESVSDKSTANKDPYSLRSKPDEKTFPYAKRIATLRFYMELKSVKTFYIYWKNCGFIAFKDFGLEIVTLAIVCSLKYSTLSV